ncbi:CLUMA_CG019186, isoform A [Clunio marinus]|uniref:CLUMA_CG019186, isoform A n=1 Tax=Clunio marinus TaxID=568069 RepID=A0A1J1J0M2_9DIPT|nr:CLUMA_CG019186, isoform A [Clunio marinus]
MKSWLWKHFLKINTDLARCQKCQKVLKRSGGTKGLVLHLEKIHRIVKKPVDESAEEKKEVEKPKISCSLQQKSMTDFLKFQSIEETVSRLAAESGLSFPTFLFTFQDNNLIFTHLNFETPIKQDKIIRIAAIVYRMEEIIDVLEPARVATESLSRGSINILTGEGIIKFLLAETKNKSSPLATEFYDILVQRINSRRNSRLLSSELGFD